MCQCSDIEHCRMERYIADVRIAVAELEALKRYSQFPPIAYSGSE